MEKKQYKEALIIFSTIISLTHQFVSFQGQQINCLSIPCPDSSSCSHGFVLEGECCADCSVCEYEGGIYQDGVVFTSQRDSCLTCRCEVSEPVRVGIFGGVGCWRWGNESAVLTAPCVSTKAAYIQTGLCLRRRGILA